ncbi:MAG: hypothetical protein CMQ24_03065 [Gammaproteobacteria bacterium]|nr:hypothetical protein [Gammaproteobacteria bacterium]
MRHMHGRVGQSLGSCRSAAIRSLIDAGRDLLKRMLQAPRHSQPDHLNAAFAAYHLEDYALTVSEWEVASGNGKPGGPRELRADAALAAAHADRKLGRVEASDVILDEWERRVSSRIEDNPRPEPYLWYRHASVATIRGDRAAALRHIQRAIDEGWRQHWRPHVEPALAELRDDRDFQAMMSGLETRMRVSCANNSPTTKPCGRNGVAERQHNPVHAPSRTARQRRRLKRSRHTVPPFHLQPQPGDPHMKIQSLGHVVIKVRNIEKSTEFYSGLLGLPVVAQNEKPKMAFFSLGNHHDFAVMEVGEDAEGTTGKQVGLAHVAFKVGDDLDALREAKSHLEGAGVQSAPVDHEVTKSLYFSDPDGNQVELYVDASDAWREEPQRVAQSGPLAL